MKLRFFVSAICCLHQWSSSSVIFKIILKGKDGLYTIRQSKQIKSQLNELHNLRLVSMQNEKSGVISRITRFYSPEYCKRFKCGFKCLDAYIHENFMVFFRLEFLQSGHQLCLYSLFIKKILLLFFCLNFFFTSYSTKMIAFVCVYIYTIKKLYNFKKNIWSFEAEFGKKPKNDLE